MASDIPDLNLFMMCETPNRKAFSTLNGGFYFDFCKRSELDIWKAFPFDGRPGEDEKAWMSRYFADVYAGKEELFYQKCLFVRDRNGKPAATGFIWEAYGQIPTLHWLKVRKELEGRGIGRALISRLLSDTRYPLYLHTQPASYRAIHLYADFGFQLITDLRIGSRRNDLEEGLKILRQYMKPEAYAGLRFAQAPRELIVAAASTKINEF